ncbi:MAG: hypothetical protein PHF17_04720 [Arcobacteraceae bacterium]|nr:hypothetical protein [Arcobacteraceae bacterium]
MKRRYISLCLLLSASALSGANLFTGVSFDYTGGTANANYGETDVHYAQGYGLKAGIEDVNYRVYADVSQIKWDNSQANQTLINGDLTFPVGKILNTKRDAKFYMGIHYGKVDFKTDLTNNDKNSGDIYGVQMGLLSPCILNEKVTIELGFKNSKTSVTTRTTTYNHELTSLTSMRLGINYSF